MAARVIHDFVCTACGCLCDDLTLTIDAGRIAAIAPPCPLAESFLRAERGGTAPTADLAASIEQAARLLRAARAPLVMGFERATVDVQRLAVEIADRLGAMIDPTDARGVSAAHDAVQTVGAVTATLGEVAQRSDLVLYWQCDPAVTHPRHMERFARRAGGRVIVVDEDRPAEGRTATAAEADEFVSIPRYESFAALATLRALVAGIEVEASEALRRLADQLLAAHYVAVFYDSSADAEAITSLVHDLHRHTRAAALRLGAPPNAVGAAQVLTWQTGFPAAVSFARGYPRYLPGEATAAQLLAGGEVDAALIVAADPLAYLPPQAVSHLHAIPTIVIDDRETATLAAAAVPIRVARFGIETTGDVYRSDGVALPLRAALSAVHPTADDVLARLAAALTA